MSIKRIKDFPSGSGSLTGDDLLLVMDDPDGSGITKSMSLDNIIEVVSSGIGLTFDGSGLVGNSTAQFNQLLPTVSGLGNVTGTVNTDATAAQVFDMTLTGNITLANPTNPINGVTVRWRITQDNNGNRGVTLGNKFVIPSTATSPLPFSTTGNKMDVLAATYHSSRDKWDIIAFVPGY